MMSEPTYIILTVDTETSPAPAETIFAQIEGEEWGITRIMDICDSFSVKATFFVDVYDKNIIDISLLRRACECINKRGHEVELHTHPDFSTKRGWEIDGVISKYNLDEQISIIKKGKQLIKNWINKEPIAHRAGGYGANYDTIRALKENGILIDCSMYYKHRVCDLNYPLLTVNKVVEYNGVTEIPVTVTFSKYVIGFPGFGLTFFSLYKKVDINWSGFDELKLQIMRLKENGINPIIVFLHSGSFVKESSSRLKPNKIVEDTFKKLTEWLTQQSDFKVLTVKEFYSECKQKKREMIGTNSVPKLILPVSKALTGGDFSNWLRRSRMNALFRYWRNKYFKSNG